MFVRSSSPLVTSRSGSPLARFCRESLPVGSVGDRFTVDPWVDSSGFASLVGDGLSALFFAFLSTSPLGSALFLVTGVSA